MLRIETGFESARRFHAAIRARPKRADNVRPTWKTHRFVIAAGRAAKPESSSYKRDAGKHIVFPKRLCAGERDPTERIGSASELAQPGRNCVDPGKQ